MGLTTFSRVTGPYHILWRPNRDSAWLLNNFEIYLELGCRVERFSMRFCSRPHSLRPLAASSLPCRPHDRKESAIASEKRNKAAFVTNMQELLLRQRASSEELVRFLSEELMHVYDMLEGLQMKYHHVEELLECYMMPSREKAHTLGTGNKRASRIFYNSERKKASRASIIPGTASHCNWCEDTDHVEKNCWRKKGGCVCGSHSLTACPKDVPRYPEAMVIHLSSRYKGNKVGLSCSQLSSASKVTPTPACVTAEGSSCSNYDRSGRIREKTVPYCEAQLHLKKGIREPSGPSTLGTVSFQRISSGVDSYFDSLKLHECSDSACFTSKGRISASGANCSQGSSSEQQRFNDSYYKLCSDVNTDPEENWSKEEDSGVSPGSHKAEDCEVILASMDETWEVSSMKDRGCPEVTPVDRDHLRSDQESNNFKQRLSKFGSFVVDTVRSRSTQAGRRVHVSVSSRSEEGAEKNISKTKQMLIDKDRHRKRERALHEDQHNTILASKDRYGYSGH